MKRCPKCTLVKETTEFHKSKKRVDGLQLYCKSCRKEIDADSYKTSESRQEAIKARRAVIRKYNSELLSRYKRFCKCKVCGESEPIALDLHHLNADEKDMNPSSAVTCSTDTLKAEIRKCVVLCANCHREVHYGFLDITNLELKMEKFSTRFLKHGL